MPTLDCRPCTDSPALASARRMELDISRTSAIHLGRTAVEAIERGYYEGPDGRPRDWQALIATAVAQRVSIPPDAPLPDAMLPAAECARVDATHVETTRVEVANETTMAASHRLTMAGHRPLALNFANGVQPGGGFLEGSRAQEEGLCRSSGLYATLTGDAMYAAHRRRPTPDSTDWAILSPRVPVFRRDDSASLDAPWLLDVLTCAAPVASRIG